MRTRTRMLDGELLDVDAPGAATLSTATAVSVVDVDSTELELTAGPLEVLEFFLSSTSTTLDRQVTLRNQLTMRHGALGGTPRHGRAFAVEVAEHRVFGSVPPGLALDDLTAWLGRMTFASTREGARVDLGPGQSWSATRAHAVAQHVGLDADTGYLLDVRRARTRSARARTAGHAVRGGSLSRSPRSDEHRHVVLDAPEFVSYGLPLAATSLDEVATSMSTLTTELA
ncbi:hypothetical protein [Janibacter anophelis]|uniref:hypothetical protein n=1 Tax=Janibacter anophelis TaxID=319054 RepID=UPI000AEE3FA2|nr:hypothetical protein [Janibacter anophelis]